MKETTPLVIFRSVARNAEKTIRRTIESIYAQTHKNWELHLVDNASTDGTLSIMENYAAKDPRVRVYKNEGNYVWKKGNRFTDYYNEYDLDNTYMCQIDADDEYKPEFAKKMLEFADEHNLDIACCGYENIDITTGEKLDELKVDKTLIIEGEGFGTYFTAYHKFARFRIAKLYKLTVTAQFVVTDNVDILHGGDTVEALEYFRNARRVGICPEQYYIYYYYRSSLSKKWWNSRAKDDRTVYDITVNFLLDKAGTISQENRDFLHRVFNNAIRDNIAVLMGAQNPFEEKIAALHDVVTSTHTRELIDYICTTTDDKNPGGDAFRAIISFIAQNQASIRAQNTMKQVYAILAVIEVFSDDYEGTGATVLGTVLNENAQSVLEISGYDDKYGRLIKERQNHKPAALESIKIDRIDLTDSNLKSSFYDSVFLSDALTAPGKLGRYDVIIIFHLFENMDSLDAKSLLETLLTKTNKQVLVLTPEYPYDLTSSDENKKSNVRAYHPIFFLGMDFSYKMLQTSNGATQAYSFFPPAGFEPLACDGLPESIDKSRKLKIAYVLFSHGKTGAVKAIYRHIKELSKNGHIITVYYRESVAAAMNSAWSLPEDAGVSKQVTVPDNAAFTDYIDNQDIIILSWWRLTPEFENSKIPVALWEQGSEALYGDFYGQLRSSSEQWRSYMCSAYRVPVNLLAVSPSIQKVLKGRYNRDSQFFPAGIDTDFYYPADNKKNDVPVVLLVGAPLAVFKGFMFAFGVLESAYKKGNKFKVQLATQVEFEISPPPSFPFEIITDPPQEKLAEIYRNADIFISASLYESFPLPPIEAMASGVAVIATDSGGINSYAEPGVNCLLCEQGDYHSMIYALETLLGNPQMREEISRAGRETALRFNMQSILPQLEECLYKIAEQH